MREWLRRWLGIAEQGTILIEADGSIIVGCPRESTWAEMESVRLRFREWAATPGMILVLPFPVAVVDKRPCP